MIVMPANSSGMLAGYLACRYEGQLGHLFSPGDQRGPWPFMPYALDNGAFKAWKHRRTWDVARWRELLAWANASRQAPTWVLVPDVVADRVATLRAWDRYAADAAAYGWPLAFAAQDGMEPADVPREAAVVFLGGSDDWKPRVIVPWCRAFPRVHVGRVNGYDLLVYCERAGAESCDGTGWFRGDDVQLRGLLRWLEETRSGTRPALTRWEILPAKHASAREGQTSLSFDDTAAPMAVGGKSCSDDATAACTADRTPTTTDQSTTT